MTPIATGARSLATPPVESTAAWLQRKHREIALIVIGGGIVGLTTAWFLTETGYAVTLLEGMQGGSAGDGTCNVIS